LRGLPPCSSKQRRRRPLLLAQADEIDEILDLGDAFGEQHPPQVEK
jgi:hypothetical protein